MIWTSSQIAQNTLASLLEQRKFNNVFSGSPVLRQILGRSMKLVLQQKTIGIDVVEYQAYQWVLSDSIQEQARVHKLMTQYTIAGTMYGRCWSARKGSTDGHEPTSSGEPLAQSCLSAWLNIVLQRENWR